MKRIAIVVGHSYKAQGAKSESGITEYQFNSQFACKLASELHKQDCQPIILYRDELKDLPSLVNLTKADTCISLHCNAYNHIATGSETLYFHASNKSKALAERVQRAMTNCLGLKDRGIKPILSGDRGAIILQQTAMPCVLIEPCFMDNYSDFDALEDNQDALAKSLASVLK